MNSCGFSRDISLFSRILFFLQNLICSSADVRRRSLFSEDSLDGDDPYENQGREIIFMKMRARRKLSPRRIVNEVFSKTFVFNWKNHHLPRVFSFSPFLTSWCLISSKS